MKKTNSPPSAKIRALIIDDEPEAINVLLHLTKDMDMVEITGTISDPEKILSAYLKASPDLLLLDIQLGTRTGFDVLQELHEHKLYPLVIFTTAHDQYLLKAIRSGAFDYLLKPIDKSELFEALTKVQRQLEEHSIEKRMEALEKAVKNHRKLSFNTRSGLILIHPDEIFYIEADASYSEIHLSATKREVVSMNIGAVLDLLPSQFIRISRSLIINSYYLAKLSGNDRLCILRKETEEKKFKVPEKQIAELRRIIGTE